MVFKYQISNIMFQTLIKSVWTSLLRKNHSNSVLLRNNFAAAPRHKTEKIGQTGFIKHRLVNWKKYFSSFMKIDFLPVFLIPPTRGWKNELAGALQIERARGRAKRERRTKSLAKLRGRA
jgi:hypothetical protein